MPKPFVVCAVITNSIGQYLLIKRARDPYLNHWALVSGLGASKKGLSPAEAVLNEVQFDLGTEFTGHLAFTYQLENVNYADTVYVYNGIVNPHQITLNQKSATAYGWFTKSAIKDLGDLAFADEWVLDRIYKAGKG